MTRSCKCHDKRLRLAPLRNADERKRLAPLKNAIMIDSGAQISATPKKLVTKHNYATTDSDVVV